METMASVKGQIVIPSPVRRKLGIKKGTRILIEVDEKRRRIILRPITREYVRSLMGMYRGKGLMKALMAEKKRERELPGSAGVSPAEPAGKMPNVTYR